MNARHHLKGNSWTTARSHLDYSRHLCATTRSSTLLGTRTSKSFSDNSETATFVGKTGQNRNVTLVRQLSDEGRVLRRRVYCMDQTFLRKLGHKNGILEKHSVAPNPNLTNRKVYSKKPVHYGIDNDTRSFCDSVSSIACSNFANENREQKVAQDCNKISDQMEKFVAIENWLLNLSTPDYI